MTYFTTALDLLDLPEGAEAAVRVGGRVFYRLTPRTHAWVLCRVARARQAAQAGRMPAETLREVCERLEALRTHAAASTPGFPFPDDPQAAGPGELPPEPRNWSDAELDALAAFWADEPDAAGCVLLRWPCGTALALSPESLAAWDGTAGGRKAAGAGPGEPLTLKATRKAAAAADPSPAARPASMFDGIGN